jgi:hypothetical protein
MRIEWRAKSHNRVLREYPDAQDTAWPATMKQVPSRSRYLMNPKACISRIHMLDIHLFVAAALEEL